ncbi:MAG TPA: HesA/MoeB/ThiF family protein [Polyangiaceae bacterium]|nr:HesA/MoeB/ThiF family protein [Polyangiaceae bacterium]
MTPASSSRDSQQRVRSSHGALTGRRVLVVGVGGLGCAALVGLRDSGATFVLADDDRVDLSNLHRQLLFTERDVGRDKLDAARDALLTYGVRAQDVELVRSRFLPENARQLARSVDLVLEGADNFATKFLAADACFLERKPVVHGSAIRFEATAWCVAAAARPCYRCLFEDVPASGERQLSCNEAGVLGPVVGLCGAFMAELALRYFTGLDAQHDCIHTLDGRRNRVRSIRVAARAGCALCGDQPSIDEIIENRYTAPSCAA